MRHGWTDPSPCAPTCALWRCLRACFLSAPCSHSDTLHSCSWEAGAGIVFTRAHETTSLQAKRALEAGQVQPASPILQLTRAPGGDPRWRSWGTADVPERLRKLCTHELAAWCPPHARRSPSARAHQGGCQGAEIIFERTDPVEPRGEAGSQPSGPYGPHHRVHRRPRTTPRGRCAEEENGGEVSPLVTTNSPLAPFQRALVCAAVGVPRTQRVPGLECAAKRART